MDSIKKKMEKLATETAEAEARIERSDLSIYLDIYLSIYLSIYIYKFIYLSVHFFNEHDTNYINMIARNSPSLQSNLRHKCG